MKYSFTCRQPLPYAVATVRIRSFSETILLMTLRMRSEPPSTTSSSVSRLLASSTVITPSLPTLSIASAMILPIVSSPLAEMVPTWAIFLCP